MGKALQLTAALAALVAAAVWRAVFVFGGIDDAFYELLPYVPAEAFAAVGSVGVRLLTCEGRPAVDALRWAGLLAPRLECFPDRHSGGPDSERRLPVAVSTVKGGSILYARLFIQTAHRCGLCVGYGFRPNGNWPPPHETVPSYSSDALLAIAFVDQWRAYALSEVGLRENVDCVATVRDPLSRAVSMYLYFESAGELALRPVSAHLLSLSSVAERVAWMWDTIGEETMISTHKYLTDSIEFGCAVIRFEAFASDFNKTATTAFAGWGVASGAHAALLADVQKLDQGRRSAAELSRDHHHTSSKFPSGYKRAVRAAFVGLPRAMTLLAEQRRDLGYSDDASQTS